jgi:hypothetical protein
MRRRGHRVSPPTHRAEAAAATGTSGPSVAVGAGLVGGCVQVALLLEGASDSFNTTPAASSAPPSMLTS